MMIYLLHWISGQIHQGPTVDFNSIKLHQLAQTRWYQSLFFSKIKDISWEIRKNVARKNTYSLDVLMSISTKFQ